jgi:hypothetical protein
MIMPPKKKRGTGFSHRGIDSLLDELREFFLFHSRREREFVLFHSRRERRTTSIGGHPWWMP